MRGSNKEFFLLLAFMWFMANMVVMFISLGTDINVNEIGLFHSFMYNFVFGFGIIIGGLD